MISVLKSVSYIMDQTRLYYESGVIVTEFSVKRLPVIIETLNYAFKPPYLDKNHPRYNYYGLYLGK